MTRHLTIEASNEQVESIIRESCRNLWKSRDFHLIKVNSSERSIAHVLASHLKFLVGDEWDVDCEYNRDKADPKYLEFHGKNKLVFPYIVIHRRGKNENLLAIELKKTPRLRSNPRQ